MKCLDKMSAMILSALSNDPALNKSHILLRHKQYFIVAYWTNKLCNLDGMMSYV